MRGYTSQPFGPLAQLVEQGTLNPKVEGSIPSRPTCSDPVSLAPLGRRRPPRVGARRTADNIGTSPSRPSRPRGSEDRVRSARRGAFGSAGRRARRRGAVAAARGRLSDGGDGRARTVERGDPRGRPRGARRRARRRARRASFGRRLRHHARPRPARVGRPDPRLPSTSTLRGRQAIRIHSRFWCRTSASRPRFVRSSLSLEQESIEALAFVPLLHAGRARRRVRRRLPGPARVRRTGAAARPDRGATHRDGDPARANRSGSSPSRGPSSRRSSERSQTASPRRT